MPNLVDYLEAVEPVGVPAVTVWGYGASGVDSRGLKSPRGRADSGHGNVVSGAMHGMGVGHRCLTINPAPSSRFPLSEPFPSS